MNVARCLILATSDSAGAPDQRSQASRPTLPRMSRSSPSPPRARSGAASTSCPPTHHRPAHAVADGHRVERGQDRDALLEPIIERSRGLARTDFPLVGTGMWRHRGRCAPRDAVSPWFAASSQGHGSFPNSPSAGLTGHQGSRRELAERLHEMGAPRSGHRCHARPRSTTSSMARAPRDPVVRHRVAATHAPAAPTRPPSRALALGRPVTALDRRSRGGDAVAHAWSRSSRRRPSTSSMPLQVPPRLRQLPPRPRRFPTIPHQE